MGDSEFEAFVNSNILLGGTPSVAVTWWPPYDVLQPHRASLRPPNDPSYRTYTPEQWKDTMAKFREATLYIIEKIEKSLQ